MAHRLLICAGLSKGRSEIANITLSDDIKATIDALRKLGRNVDIKGDICIVDGDINFDGGIIDCKESGSSLRFLVPIISALGGGEFTGEGRLGKRPLSVYKDIFEKQGLNLKEGFPLKVEGSLMGGVFEVRGDISSQFISGLMLAAPLLKGETRIKIITPLQSRGYVYMTIQAMKKFGVDVSVEKEDRVFFIESGQKYISANVATEGDWSQAGFWLLGGINSVEGIAIEGLRNKTHQGDKAILNILKEMNANMIIRDDSINIERSELRPQNIDISQCPDLAPVVAGLMSLTEEKCVLGGCERLRIKESDRIESIVCTLKSLGSNAEVEGDRIIIEGRPKGGKVKTFGDHRIAMMAAALAPHCEGEVIVEDETVVNKSYPKFWDDYRALGGKYV